MRRVTEASAAAYKGSMDGARFAQPLSFRVRLGPLVGAVLLLVGGITAAAVILSGLSGSPRSGGPPGRQHPQHPAESLSQVVVPVDATERQWRTWVLAHGYGITLGHRVNLIRLAREVRSAIAASGARLVRLKLWEANTTWPPVELVGLLLRVRPSTSGTDSFRCSM